MKNKKDIIWYVFFFILLAGCSSQQKLIKKDQGITEPSSEVSTPRPATPAPGPVEISPAQKLEDEAGYRIRPLDIEIQAGRTYLPVGAEIISKKGHVPLNLVIKKLGNLKGFSVSWADDVDQGKLVDVDIRPEDNFWDAMDNILRQLDYFYEVKGDTIIVRYKETKQYYLAMPLLKEEFETEVGGDLLGGGAAEGRMSGTVEIKNEISEPLEVWKEIEENLQTIIERSSRERLSIPVEQSSSGEEKTAKAGGKCPSASVKTGKGEGYFIIDLPVGLITVTAPRKTQIRVDAYLESLKKQIYKQVIIEAKIIEIRLSDSHKMGIDWAEIFNTALSFNVSFGKNGTLYPWPDEEGFISKISLNTKNDLNVMLAALNEYGNTNILSNPKISLLNGHGATMTVGENVTYIDKVTTTTSSETQTVTYTVTTDSVLSGVGLAVMANIIDDEEVILYVVPITSELTEPIEEKEFGGGAARIGLPRVRLKQMSTYAKLRNGQTLIIGGLIDETKIDKDKRTPVLGDVPFLGRFFQMSNQQTIKRELVILLKPRIIDMSARGF